jgi:nitronate monooxygenase
MCELGVLNMNESAFPTSAADLKRLRTLAEKAGLVDFSPLWNEQNASSCRAVSAVELM